jgi:hypothetical protein
MTNNGSIYQAGRLSKSGLNTPAGKASLKAEPNPPDLKMFERADWTLFRTVEGLQQKAGVAAQQIRRLVLKELGDNGLDGGGRIEYGLVEPDPDTFFVEDDGPGLDLTPKEIAELFSISRPLRSSKLIRLPQRGQLGNGLRVVAGAALASGGSLAVITHNRRITLRPQSDGSTKVVAVVVADQPIGTRIEISFGPALPRDSDPFAWVRKAQAMAGVGQSYQGRSSPFWYDIAQFHELLLACGPQPVRNLIAQLDGCTGGKAGEIVAGAGLDRRHCQNIDRQQATTLLMAARKQARPVSADRLGHVGRDAFPDFHYAKELGITKLGGTQPQAEIPFVVEAWARKSPFRFKGRGDLDVDFLINRTPAVAEISAWRNGDSNLCLQGSGLAHFWKDAPKKGDYTLTVNVTTPYCPITSDDKEPDLEPFAGAILNTIATAMRKARRLAPKDKKVSQKDVVLDNLDAVIASVSGDGEYRFNTRQLFYQLRPIDLEETAEELKLGNYTSIITDYEAEYGEIPGMYREPRGSIYHPHRGETITLGTLMVEQYERPVWTFNKLIYIEKEGANEALKEVRWGERHDCAIMSSKGFSTRAARDLIDKLAEHGEPVDVFCAHDADGPGTMIFQTLQEATRARGARKIKIINLGLEPWEAVTAGLEVENLPQGEKRKAVADYVLERDDGEHWANWLQTHRVELNAMTTPEFIAWLDAKMDAHGAGKLIPPADVIVAELETKLEGKIRDAITEQILREARVEDQISTAMAAITRPNAVELQIGIEDLFEREPEAEWRKQIESIAEDLSPDRDET